MSQSYFPEKLILLPDRSFYSFILQKFQKRRSFLGCFRFKYLILVIFRNIFLANFFWGFTFVKYELNQIYIDIFRYIKENCPKNSLYIQSFPILLSINPNITFKNRFGS